MITSSLLDQMPFKRLSKSTWSARISDTDTIKVNFDGADKVFVVRSYSFKQLV